MVRSSREDEKRLLEEIYAKAQRRRAVKKAGVPQVGIVFLVKGKIFIDGTPVTEAEDYVHFKIHDRDHHRYYHEHTWHECGDRDDLTVEVGTGLDRGVRRNLKQR